MQNDHQKKSGIHRFFGFLKVSQSCPYAIYVVSIPKMLPQSSLTSPNTQILPLFDAKSQCYFYQNVFLVSFS